jgi:hypothetical protein
MKCNETKEKYKYYILESLNFDINIIEQCTKIIIPENLSFNEMDDKTNLKINFVNDDISIIFTSENNLNIIDKLIFKFKNIINLIFQFKSIKFILHYQKLIILLDSIRNNNLEKKIKLHFSCNFFCENNISIDCQNIIELKINDVLYNFSSLNLNYIFNKNRKFSSLILKNMKLNTNQQVKNFFQFINNPNEKLENLQIKNLNVEILDNEEPKLYHYIKIINNQIYFSLKGNDFLFQIDNIILKKCPLSIIEHNENSFNNINISIDQTSLIKINFCGIVKYKYIKDKGYDLSFNYDYLDDDDEKDENQMEIDTSPKDNNNKLNNFESLQKYINNKNLKCYKLKFSNFKKNIEIGYPESIEEIYFEYCSSNFTQSILDKLPNVKTLKLKGITENKNIQIPKSIENLIIIDSYFEIQDYSLMELNNLTLSFYCLNDIKLLNNQINEYDKTILSIKKLLTNGNLKNIILEGDDEIIIPFDSKDINCINNEIVTFQNCTINIQIFDYIKNFDKEFIFNECIFQENDLKIFIKLKIITFDYYTFNKILFSQIQINDIDDFIQNLYHENLTDKFLMVQDKIKIFNSTKIKIITKNIEEYRQINMIFLIFKNSIKFKSIEDLKREFNDYFKNNIIIFDKNEQNIIPITLSDFYFSAQQIEFISNLQNTQIILINKNFKS